MTRVDREPYVFEHPGLEFFVTHDGRLGLRIGSPAGGRLLYVTHPAVEPFPRGWEPIARTWLARDARGVPR